MPVRMIALLPWLGALASAPPAVAEAPPANPPKSAANSDSLALSDATADPRDQPSHSVSRLRNWVKSSGDNHGLPFVIVDKAGGAVFVFDPSGRLLGAAPALLGSAIGDDSMPGVGDRELSRIPPDQRTTPAGRFVASYGVGTGSARVLWVDFASAVSLHAVVTANRAERRLERLNSPTPEDNRITFGCINVPTEFYNEIIRPVFGDTTGIFYIIPETRALDEVFMSFRDAADYGSSR